MEHRPQIILAEPHGFCAGVRRALALADEALAALPPGGRVFCLHRGVRRSVAEGRAVVFVGARGHDETEGVAGEAPGKVFVAGTAAEAEALA